MKNSALAPVSTALTAIFIIAIAGLSLWFGAASAWSDASSLRARWLVSQWRAGSGPVFSVALWQQTHDELQAALQLAPDHAQLMDDLGFLYATRAMRLGVPAVGSAEHVLRQTLLAKATANYRAATLARPTFAYSWAYLALAKHLSGEPDTELWTAFDKAVRYGRNEAGLQPAIAQVAFAHWRELSPERKSQITTMLATARPDPRKRLLDLATLMGVVLPE